MTVGGGAIGSSAIGASGSVDAGVLSVTDLTTGSPSFGTPTLYVMPFPGIDANCIILLHGDGTNGSTTIVDSAPPAHTFTANGDAQLSTTSPKFGSADITFDGTGDYVDTPDAADLSLGSGDWTVDFWFNVSGGNGTTRRLCGQVDSSAAAATSAWHVTLGAGNTIGVNASNGSAFVGVITTTTITASGWHHFAGVRTGNVLRAFLDGVQEGGDVAFTGTVPDSAAKLAVGRRGEQNSGYFPGQIDEFRLSVGVARWTADFPVPPVAYFATLTANNLTTASPSLDSPAMYFGLTATALTTGSPSLDTPTLSHKYSATANDLTTGSPVLDTPAAAVNYHLTASDLTTGSPSLDTPSASVFHSLTATGLTTGSPDLDTPSISTGNQLTVTDLVTGSPVLDTPAAVVHYFLTANDLVTASPELGAPALMYGLLATDLTTGSPDLGTPFVPADLTASDLVAGSPDLDTPALVITYPANDLVTGSPDLGTPPLSHHYVVLAFDFETGSPDLDAPIPFVSMVALDLETASPEIDSPTCDHQVLARPELLVNIDDILLDPIYASVIGHPARLFAGSFPPIDLTVINHTEMSEFEASIDVLTIRPHVDVRVKELAVYGVHRADLNGGQIMLWPDTPIQELWNIEDIGVRAGIWGEPSGELRIFLMDRQA